MLVISYLYCMLAFTGEPFHFIIFLFLDVAFFFHLKKLL